MPTWILIVMGLVVIIIVMIDIFWTTLSTNGAGPISGEVTTALWLGFRAVHRRIQSHRLLKINVVVILMTTFMTWMLLLWAGWTIVFSAAEYAVVSQATGEPAHVVERIYFVGMTLFTLGTGDFLAGSPGWRLLMACASLNGLVMITLVITYLLPVVSAGVDRRQLSLAIWGLGESADEILINGWDGHSFQTLQNHFHQISMLLTLHAERHLAYPVLQYFHASDPRADLSPRIATLDDAVTILECGVTEDKRPPQSMLRSLRQSLDCYLRRVELSHIEDTEKAPPYPDFDALRKAGLPVLGNVELIEAFAERGDHRKTMYGLLQADGWSWGD